MRCDAMRRGRGTESKNEKHKEYKKYKRRCRRMKVYGLSGKSGTGKSYQAINICHDRGIESIIDDGIFIYQNTVQAGHSAKRAQNKVTAVKTALFMRDEDRDAVAEKISEKSPESILVIGTSDRMVEKICDRLGLPAVSEMIHIEDVVNEEDLKTARKQRDEEGKHVIPVSTFEIKSQFSGYFMAPLKMLRWRGKNLDESEKTVVRPTYSYLGDFTIADKAVRRLIRHSCSKSSLVCNVSKCSINNTQEGLDIKLAVTLYMEPDLPDKACRLQKNIIKEVEQMTAFNILSVDIYVKNLKKR